MELISVVLNYNMKKYLYSLFLGLTLLTGFTFASAATVYVDQAAAGTADGTSLINAFTTIQAAIDSATTTDGDIISIANGTYPVTITINVSKELTIRGESETGTIIDTSAISGNYGISSSKSNLTFSNFTLIGPAANVSGNYGLKLSGTTANSPLYTQNGVRSTGINISNVTVKNSGKTGIDINGVNNVTLNTVTIKDTVSGNGFSITDGDNLTLTNVSTSGNTWGGIATYTRGQYFPGGVNGVTVTNLNSTEANPLYSQLSNPPAGTIYPITGITAVQFPFTGVNSGNPAFTLYRNNPFTLAANVQTLNPAATTTLKNLGNVINVGPQSIQSKIDAATTGDIIDISGIYYIDTPINVNKTVTLRGTSSDKTINASGTAYIFLITAPNVTIQDFTINKIDKTGPQNIIGVQAASTTIKNNIFVGQYVTGDTEVSRAIEVSPGQNNFLITGNNITNLRQPAYINAATGTISNNFVGGTRGWVIESDSNVTLTGNTWGTNSPLDIAIIAAATNNYSYANVDAIKLVNNNANINNAFLPVLPPVMIVPPTPVTGGGGSLILTPAVTSGNMVNTVTAPIITALQVLGTSTVQLQILGASTFKFKNNLRLGMRASDVTELQNTLITQGYLNIENTTGYFGNLTRNAVMKWQAKNINLSTGFFGPISREFINR